TRRAVHRRREDETGRRAPGVAGQHPNPVSQAVRIAILSHKHRTPDHAHKPRDPTIMGAVARVIDLVKNYYMEEVVVPALRGVTLGFGEGDFIALMGPSGSGKSTLLNLLGCLDRCTSGQYFLGAEDVPGMNDDQLAEVRSRYIGFIFQSYNLLPQYTVVENIEIPLLYQGCRITDATRQHCISLAELVGLGDRLDHRPTQLSGGQQQRVAIA